MRVHTDINNLPVFKNAALTIGTFDGVHCGHVQIIRQLKREASRLNGESVIITFHPHPRTVITGSKPEQSKTGIRLLNTLDEKIKLLTHHRIDHLVVVPFTLDFASQSAEAYISDFLVARFHPRCIIIGYDHRFGKDRAGDYRLLEKYQSTFHYEVKEISEQVLHDVTVSSTCIRKSLNTGDVRTANEYLGYDYFFEGEVVKGNQIGRTLGYPTANIEVADEQKLTPAYGVYAVVASVASPDGSFADPLFFPSLYGVMNIGIRPTIGDGKIMTEVHLFDFNEEIYGRKMRVYIRQFMRPEIKFATMDELVAQMKKDEAAARKLVHMQ